MVSEKVGGAEGTKLDDDFRDLERVREPSLCSLTEKHAEAEGLCGFTEYTGSIIVLFLFDLYLHAMESVMRSYHTGSTVYLLYVAHVSKSL